MNRDKSNNQNKDASPITTKENIDIEKYINTSLVEIVTKKIRSNIYKGKYEPGKRLIVRELAEELGVSHTPVKDALNRLVSEGYIEALPRRSMVVRQYTNHDFVENLEVRLMSELYCVDIIIDKISVNDNLIDIMKNDLKVVKNSMDENGNIDYEKWILHDSMFHRRYMQLCDNQKLVRFYTDLDSNRFSYFAYLQNNNMPLTNTRFQLDIEEHERIIEAIENKDKKALALAIINHISSICSEYLSNERFMKKIEKIKEQLEFFVNYL